MSDAPSSPPPIPDTDIDPDAASEHKAPKEGAENGTYHRGDALQDALEEERTPEEVGLSLADLVDNPAAWDASPKQYWEWIASLLRAGRRMDARLDDLLHEVYRCNTAFYSIGSWLQLYRILQDLYELQPQLRDLEQDVRDFQLVVTIDSDPEFRESVEMASDLVLNSAKETYDRTYQLCQTKRDRIQQGWVTATNFIISIIMLIVTILFWLEFR
jgi:hypothetical protein